jgi:DNA-binding transcriptional regulator YiaG
MYVKAPVLRLRIVCGCFSEIGILAAEGFIDNNLTIGYNINMTGEELKEWRKKWGLSQNELARMLGTYQVTVCRWEKGARSIPLLLPLALEALENRRKKGEGMKQQNNGSSGGLVYG